MAIARDNFIGTIQFQAAATSQTVAYTNNGDCLIWYGSIEGSTEVITGVTYAGVSMTQVNKIEETGTRWWYTYILKSPATGANNIVISASGSTDFRTLAASYTGADTTTQPDAQTTVNPGSSATLTANLTSTVDGDWGFLGVRNDSYPVTGTTNLTDLAGTGTIEIMDSNGSLGVAGSKTLTGTASSSGGGMYGNFLLIKAAVAAGPTNLKSLDTNLKANIKSYNTNAIANIKSIDGNA